MQRLTSANTLKWFSLGVILAIGISVYRPPDSLIWRVSRIPSGYEGGMNAMRNTPVHSECSRVYPDRGNRWDAPGRLHSL
jgi:hypothetical protein